MSDNDFVLVEGHERETAIHLIAANDQLGYPATDVRSVSAGFYVHKDVKKAAAKKPGNVTEEQPAGDAGFAPQAQINAQDWLDSGQITLPAGAEDLEAAEPDTEDGKRIQLENAAGVGSTGEAGTPDAATSQTLITDQPSTAEENEQTLVKETDEEAAARVERENAEKAEQAEKDAADAKAKEREDYLATFPKGNASKDAWLEFAAKQDNYLPEDADLPYAELKAKFGPVAE